MDPKIFNIKETESYNLTKKSDTYSLGMLFWELTSCSSPFNFEPKNDNSILKLKFLMVKEKLLCQTQMLNSLSFIKVSIKL